LGLAVLLGSCDSTGSSAQRSRRDTGAAKVAPTFKSELDVTFLVAGDTHFGAQVRLGAKTRLNPTPRPKTTDIAAVNRVMIERMNTIAGLSYPDIIGGSVARPRGLMVLGDLTDFGAPEQWKQFERHFGTDGSDGLLRMPLFALIGNHDMDQGDRISRTVHKRYGGPHYEWHWDDLHLIALNDGPDEKGLRFLRRKLHVLGGKVPVILFFHYPLRGPYSTGWWFGDGTYREQLRAAIAGHSEVIGIFHGHFHGSGYYRWHGFDVYNVGSPKHMRRSFAVVRVTQKRMTVCSYNYEAGMWWWWHAKPLSGDDKARRSKEIRGVARSPGFLPDIPHP